MADDHEHCRAGEDRDEGPAVEHKREWLHQHDHARRDDNGGKVFPRPAAKAQQAAQAILLLNGSAHFLTAPKVMPWRRCLRSRIVKTQIGIRNNVVPAATAGQSCPPSPMMNGMKGGIV